MAKALGLGIWAFVGHWSLNISSSRSYPSRICTHETTGMDEKGNDGVAAVAMADSDAMPHPVTRIRYSYRVPAASPVSCQIELMVTPTRVHPVSPFTRRS